MDTRPHAFLEEDGAGWRDVTSAIVEGHDADAVIRTRDSGIAAGVAEARSLFEHVGLTVETVVDEAIDEFGEIDIVINNASAIQLATIADLPADRFDLLTDVNVRGTHIVAHAFADHLAGQDGAWLLSNSPPVVTDRSPGKAPYAWSKLGMSFITLSLAEELAGEDVGCNTFWPVTSIDTRATRYFGLGTEDDWRSPQIVADAVLEILARDPADCTGNSFYDEALLAAAGVTDLSEYNITEGDPAPMSAQLFDPEYERT